MNTHRRLAAVIALTGVLLAPALAFAQDAETLRKELRELDRKREEILRKLEEAGQGGGPAPTTPATPAVPGATPPPAGGDAAAARDTRLAAVEVVATGFPQARGASPAAVTILEGEWFEEHQVRTVADGLRQVPGAVVTRAGSLGGSTALHLRGAGSNQVLILQDGIPLNDPTVGGQFNLFDLDVNDLDRVEVLRGSHGVLYGSDAIGGVVNLVTRRGEGPGSFRAGAEAGSFRTHREWFSGSGGDGTADWSFGLSTVQSAGRHARENFESRSFAGRLGARIGTEGRGEITLRHIDSTAENPFDFGSPIPRDSNVELERETFAAGLSFEAPVSDRITGKVRMSVTDIDSHNRNEKDPGTAGTTPEFVSTADATTTLLGASARAEILREKDDGLELAVVAGLDHETEESVNFTESPFGAGRGLDDRTINRGAYALVTATRGPVTLVGGTRHDDHSQGGEEGSPQAGVLVRVDRTRTTLRANYGEGFRAPTPVEFTDPFSGNPNLGPERSESVDAGFTQDLGGGVTLDASWFRLRTEDLIAFDLTSFRLENLARAEVKGLETGLTADLGGGWSGRATYLHQRPRDLGTGAPLANRPDRAGTVGAAWTRGAWTLTGDLVWQGGIADGDTRGPDQDLRNHPGRRVLLNLGARWRVTDTVTVFGRIENALDREYVETPTAPKAPPVGIFLGVSVDF